MEEYRPLEGLDAQARAWVESEAGPVESVEPLGRGSYNDNFVVVLRDGRRVVLRAPKMSVVDFDLRVIPEAIVLATLRDSGFAEVPRLLAASEQGWLLIEHVGDSVLDDLSKPSSSVEAFEVEQLGSLLAKLHEQAHGLADIFSTWLAEKALARSSTYRQNAEFLGRVWQRHWQQAGELAAALELPDPSTLMAQLDGDVTHLRRDGLLHGDVHRKNIRTARTIGSIWLIDWEMAQVGDPIYDMAVAIWKLKLPQPQQERLLETWATGLTMASTTGWEQDLPLYFDQEVLKTACIHLLRAIDRSRAGATPTEVAQWYGSDLRRAAPILDIEPISDDQVASVFDGHLGSIPIIE